jgi:hypothetical protein
MMPAQAPRHPWPFRSALVPPGGGRPDPNWPAVCVGCGCTDAHACAEGCSWLAVDRSTGKGVCSNCRDHLDAFKAKRA